MKPKMLVHPSQARTIDSPGEIERLLAAGWVYAKPKQRTKMAARSRALNAKRRAAGWMTQQIWMTPEQHATIKAAKRNGESTVELLVRLISQESLL